MNRELEQEPCEDEYVKVPKKALKYRTAGMVAYNAEWLKNNFDIERAVICGAQEPCKDAISREDALMCLTGEIKETDTIETIIARFARRIRKLSPVNPQPCGDLISRKAILEEFENDQYHLEFCKEHHIERSLSMEMVRIRLHDLPPVNPQPCENAISRQAVLDINESHHGQMPNHINYQIWQEIKDLPPVTPQPKMGRWIAYEVRLPDRTILNYRCSVCGRKLIGYNTETLSEAPFCHCGAKMVEPQERGKE